MLLNRLNLVFPLVGMVVGAIAFFAANARWRFTALPLWKTSVVLIGFVIVGIIAGGASFAALISWALNNCTVPDCP
jgi:DMSO reductase anchor subunit